MKRVKKKRFRLSPENAAALGFEVKQRVYNSGHPKYLLDEDQQKAYKESQKLKIDYIKNTPLSIKGTSTLYDKNGDKIVEWVKTDRQEEDRIEALRPLF